MKSIFVAKSIGVFCPDRVTQRTICWALIHIFSPLILIIAFLCSLGAGTANHNNAMMDYCFYGVSYTGEIPTEFAEPMNTMRSAFSSLDSAVGTVNEIAETDSLDLLQVKAIYYVVCSKTDADANDFVACFYTLEERTQMVTSTNEDGEEVETEEPYTVSVPYPLETAYQLLEVFLGRDITEEEKEAVQSIYLKATDSSAEVAG